MTKETQHRLYQALKAHKSELEIIRGVASGPDLEAVDRRIEATLLLLEWLSLAPEPQPPAFPAAQTQPQSSAPGDQHQTPLSAPGPPKTRR
jgi:hypothetical protein